MQELNSPGIFRQWDERAQKWLFRLIMHPLPNDDYTGWVMPSNDHHPAMSRKSHRTNGHTAIRIAHQCPYRSRGEGVLLGIPGRGLPPASPNPDPISDQSIPFYTPVFRPGP